MRKLLLAWISALFLLFAATNVFAYTDCTPSSCPSGYTDNGIVCEGAACVRNCTVEVCVNDWSQVHSDNDVKFIDDRNEDNDQSTSYTPSNVGRCYNFTFDATTLADHEVDMTVDPVSPDCDSEAIGGFWDNTQRSNPWFSGMSDYIGNVGDPEFDYLLKTMRAHTEGDADSSYRSNVRLREHISCAPNSIACNRLGGSNVCDTDCYSRATIMMTHQGYYVEQSSPDDTLYTDSECGDNAGGATDYVDDNRIGAVTPPSAQYFVYESTLTNQSLDQTCDRIHEAPSATNIRVLPETPNAGQDLLCNYTYSDPENFTEQNSTYEWWKNSVNQNINNQILNKNNLTPGDQWYCKVTPSDGLLFGTQVQSTNTVTVRNATQNPVFYVNNNAAWNETGYFGSEANVIDFNKGLNNALSSCNKDAEGFCNISLTFSSDDAGLLNVSVENSVYYIEGPIQPDTTPPSLTILNPVNNTIYNTTSINLNWTSDEALTWCAYSLNDGANNPDICPSGVPTNITIKANEGLNNITIYGNDTNGNMGQSDYIYFNVTLPDINKFYFINSSGTKVAWFGDQGNIVLKGMLEQNSNYQENPDDMFVMENNNVDVFMVAQNGSMYIAGTLAENYQNEWPARTPKDLGIYGSDGSLVALVNETGYMFLKGSLIENGNP